MTLTTEKHKSYSQKNFYHLYRTAPNDDDVNDNRKIRCDVKEEKSHKMLTRPTWLVWI